MKIQLSTLTTKGTETETVSLTANLFQVSETAEKPADYITKTLSLDSLSNEEKTLVNNFIALLKSKM